MDFWNDKDMHYRQGMIQVYKEQVQDLMKIVPEFKIANAVIHFDEVSPHMHLVGVPIKADYKRGMRKQPAKSKVFTKESLTKLQDEMRVCCIKSYNKVYTEHSLLKQKKKGRNRDIDVKDMDGYADIKRNIEKNTQKLAEANKQTKTLDNESNDIKEMLSNLKPSKLNKNNMLIPNENIEKTLNYISKVNDTTKTIRSVNDLNIAIKDFETSAFQIVKENRSLKYQLELKDGEIESLENELSHKESIIDKLRAERDKIKEDFNKFKGFWHSLMSHFHKKICYDNDKNYKIVSDDLYRNGIFDDNNNEIANDIARKVTIPDKNKYNDTRF